MVRVIDFSSILFFLSFFWVISPLVFIPLFLSCNWFLIYFFVLSPDSFFFSNTLSFFLSLMWFTSLLLFRFFFLSFFHSLLGTYFFVLSLWLVTLILSRSFFLYIYDSILSYSFVFPFYLPSTHSLVLTWRPGCDCSYSSLTPRKPSVPSCPLTLPHQP